jgi:urease accessory protein
VVKASHVYVPLTLSGKAMDAVMEAHRLAGVSWSFARGAEVLPLLSPAEARRLFGVVPGHDHKDGHRPLRPETG